MSRATAAPIAAAQHQQAEDRERRVRSQQDHRAGEPEDEEDGEGPAASARERLQRPAELGPGIPGPRQGLLPLHAHGEAVGEAQVGDGKRDEEDADCEHWERGP